METIDMERSRLEYREHKWTVHRPEESGDRPSTRDAHDDWHVCDSDSRGAADYWGASERRFYFDLELLAADLAPSSGGSLAVLTEPWRGHQPGALAMTVFHTDKTAEWGFVTVVCVADDPFPQQRIA